MSLSGTPPEAGLRWSATRWENPRMLFNLRAPRTALLLPPPHDAQLGSPADCRPDVRALVQDKSTALRIPAPSQDRGLLRQWG